MSSQMGHVGGPIRSVYNMNKWGLEGLTKGMSLDLAKYNIRVNTICPTFVVTPMTKKFLKNKKIKKYKWIAWAGLIAILIVAIELIYTDIKILFL